MRRLGYRKVLGLRQYLRLITSSSGLSCWPLFPVIAQTDSTHTVIIWSAFNLVIGAPANDATFLKNHSPGWGSTGIPRMNAQLRVDGSYFPGLSVGRGPACRKARRVDSKLFRAAMGQTRVFAKTCRNYCGYFLDSVVLRLELRPLRCATFLVPTAATHSPLPESGQNLP